ncbi:hypothetical protein ACIRFF_36685, partial [Streptomyces cyaneofuscatus]
MLRVPSGGPLSGGLQYGLRLLHGFRLLYGLRGLAAGVRDRADRADVAQGAGAAGAQGDGGGRGLQALGVLRVVRARVRALGKLLRGEPGAVVGGRDLRGLQRLLLGELGLLGPLLLERHRLLLLLRVLLGLLLLRRLRLAPLLVPVLLALLQVLHPVLLPPGLVREFGLRGGRQEGRLDTGGGEPGRGGLGERDAVL